MRTLATPNPMAESIEVSDEQLHALADFRYQLRGFMRASEEICKAEGVTPLQYQMLLQSRAVPGRPWVLVGELAGRLRSSVHGAVALVSRAEAAGLVTRKPNPTDGREVQVHATPRGRRLLQRIAARHLHELGPLSKALREISFSQD
jgi:DNA-binding MarR family transcriptional regulator